jgi:BirA family biotin operon repressor/biotin-[acetyl-CoA-carboxylase] ligase
MHNPATSSDFHLPPLDTTIVGRWLLMFDEVTSTQELARERREDGAVYVAETQTAGRGTQGRAWHSAPGTGLWLSVCLEGPPQGLSAAAALAVREAIWPEAPAHLDWPNDVMLGGLKVAGVLVEHREGWNAVGIGLNVNQRAEDFPPELRGTAGSLAMCTGHEWDRAQLLGDILRALDLMVMELRNGHFGPLHARWSRTLGILGQRVRQGEVVGTVRAIEESGALVIDMAGTRHRIMRGPITREPAGGDE